MDLVGGSFSGWIALSAMIAGLGLPLGIPPDKEDPMMARVAPEQCLFYMTWNGTVPPNPDSPNQTEKLMAQPEVRRAAAGVEERVRQRLEELAKQRDPRLVPLVDDAVRWGKILVRRSGAAFITAFRPSSAGFDVDAGLVVNLRDDAVQVRDAMVKYQAQFYPGGAKQFDSGGATWYRVQLAREMPPVTWGVVGQYFIAAIGRETPEGILARSRGEPPPWFAEASRQTFVPRRGTLAYINVRGIGDAIRTIAGPAQGTDLLQALGLENVPAVFAATGLDDNGFISRTVFAVQGQPSGLFGLAASGPLRPADLRPVPQEAIIGAAGTVHPVVAWDAILAAWPRLAPASSQRFIEGVGRLEDRLGVSVRDDVLASLGDVWRLYVEPAQQKKTLALPQVAAVMSVRDPQRLAAVQDKIVQYLDSPQGQQFQVFGFPLVVVRTAAGNRTIYSINIAAGFSPVNPAWILTDRELVLSLSREGIQGYLARDPRSPSLAQLPQVAAAFQSGPMPMMLAYRDPGRAIQQFIPLAQFLPDLGARLQAQFGVQINTAQLPSIKDTLTTLEAVAKNLRPSLTVLRPSPVGIELVSQRTLPGGNPASTGPMALALMLPVLQTTREMTAREQSSNHLMQLTDALLRYQDTHNGLPPAYLADAQGRPLLSWRVLILPMIGQLELYRQFHLNEPWDSPHNRRLIERMPGVFRSPLSTTPTGSTNYMAIRGEDTMFPPNELVSTVTMNGEELALTGLLVEVNDQRASVWTRPDDFVPNPNKPTDGLLGLQRNGFLMSLADGNVRFMAQATDPRILMAMFTRGDKGFLIERARLATPRAAPVRR